MNISNHDNLSTIGLSKIRIAIKLKIGPGHAKMCVMPYANNKSADQAAHLCSLISTFVVLCLDSIIPILAKSKISGL